MAVTLHLLLAVVMMVGSVDAGRRYVEDDRMSYWQQMLNSARRDASYRDDLYRRDAPYRDEILQRRESRSEIDAEHAKCVSQCNCDENGDVDVEQLEICLDCKFTCDEKAAFACDCDYGEAVRHLLSGWRK